MISKILALDGNVIAENRQMLEYLRQKRSFLFYFNALKINLTN